MKTVRLTPEPLTAAAFAPCGDVIETKGHEPLEINYGQTLRYNDLARIDTADAGGRPLLSLFKSRPVDLPFRIRVMEYHPLGSQAFVPLQDDPFLVVVAPPAAVLQPEHIRVFISNGRQGVNYHKGTWHHFQLSLAGRCEYLVIDRGGAGDNCVESRLETEFWVER